MKIMKRITNSTRKDIIDIIRYGIQITFDSPQYDAKSGDFIQSVNIKMPVSGRLNELDFLSRLYNLDNMPSKDSRFSNASGDIYQHTILNNDWDEYWYFSDDRFHLSNGNDDEYILKFLCEMFNSVVRDETSEWKKFLEIFNKLLKQDGYELVPYKNEIGYEIFEYREIKSISINHSIKEIHATMKLLGEGSYAKVFRYMDKFYDKDFALKRAKENLNEKELERFRREFDEMKKLKSPYIIEVYSFNGENNEYKMELADYNLDEYIKHNNSKMNLDSRRSIAMQFLAALRYLHSRNILHRDICPKNILLKVYDDVIVVKLSDFGLLKLKNSTLTADDTDCKGSYNDPSLREEGFKNYSLLHEIYSTTLVCGYILTGKDINGLFSTKDSPIKNFIGKGTSMDKAKRFQTLDELKQALINCLDSMQNFSQMEKN